MILSWRDFVWSIDPDDGVIEITVCGLVERFHDFDTAGAWCAAICIGANA